MKTAAELNISQGELDAMLKVRDLFASGQIAHADDVESGNAFCMSVEAAPNECGSVCCIGGWMSAVMQGAIDNGKVKFSHVAAWHYVDGAEGELAGLFFPQSVHDWDSIKIPEAIKAIDNFTSTGTADWPSIIS